VAERRVGLIFSGDGSLVHQAHGQEVDQEVLDGLVETLRDLLEAS
jgi:hypothetical protein